MHRRLLALALLLSFACDNDKTSDGPSDGAGEDSSPEIGESTSVDIEAAMGGTVELGEAKMVIPPGALTEDTTITVDVLDSAALPAAETIIASVYDFGPDGLTFATPVTIAIAVDPADIPADRVATIAYLEDGQWKPLTDSSMGAGEITATTTHFTPFTIVLTSAGQTGGSCGDALGQTSCGGDLVGKWAYSGACFSFADDGNPLEGCSGAQLSITVDVVGTIDFAQDGTYAATGTLSTEATISVPKSCVGGSCDGLAEDMYEDVGDACEKHESGMESNEGTGTYATSGSSITLDDDMGEFCVDGDQARLLITQSSGHSFGVMLERM